VRVRHRTDITLELIQEVAWRGSSLEIAPEAVALMDRSHETFDALVAQRLRDLRAETFTAEVFR
jgi:hypothetical protein